MNKPFQEKIDKILNDNSNLSIKVGIENLSNNIVLGINKLIDEYEEGLITKDGINRKINEGIPKIKSEYESLIEKQRNIYNKTNNKLKALLKTDLDLIESFSINRFTEFDFQRVNHKREMISYLSNEVLTELYYNSFTISTLEAAEWYHALMSYKDDKGSKAKIARVSPHIPLIQINSSNGYLSNGGHSYNNFDHFLSSKNILLNYNGPERYTLDFSKYII